MKQSITKLWHSLTKLTPNNKMWASILLLVLFLKVSMVIYVITVVCLCIFLTICGKMYIEYLNRRLDTQKDFIKNEMKTLFEDLYEKLLKDLKIDANLTINKFLNLGDIKEVRK